MQFKEKTKWKVETKYIKARYVKSSMPCIANCGKFTFWYNYTLLLTQVSGEVLAILL